MNDPRVRLFAYGSLLPGERDADLMRDAERIADATTAPVFHLVDLGPFGAMVPGGSLQIVGTLYWLDRRTRARIDVRKEHPRLFHRQRIELSDGTVAEAYVMMLDQVRGRRRLKTGNWRDRFAVHSRASGPWSDWARSRRRGPSG